MASAAPVVVSWYDSGVRIRAGGEEAPLIVAPAGDAAADASTVAVVSWYDQGFRLKPASPEEDEAAEAAANVRAWTALARAWGAKPGWRGAVPHRRQDDRRERRRRAQRRGRRARGRSMGGGLRCAAGKSRRCGVPRRQSTSRARGRGVRIDRLRTAAVEAYAAKSVEVAAQAACSLTAQCAADAARAVHDE